MRAKSNANKRKTTANPLKLLGVAVESADARCAISVPFNNESREKAITISKIYKETGGSPCSFGWAGTDCEETARSFFPKKERRGETSLKSAIDFQCRIAFVRFSIDRDSMGQQHRVRVKRKRRVAYVRRKNAARRVAATRSTPAKQPAQKESGASE